MKKKITLGLFIISPTKIDSRWMKYLIVNNKNVKFLVQNKEIVYMFII
jgi:hypothetical protein